MNESSATTNYLNNDKFPCLQSNDNYVPKTAHKSKSKHILATLYETLNMTQFPSWVKWVYILLLLQISYFWIFSIIENREKIKHVHAIT